VLARRVGRVDCKALFAWGGAVRRIRTAPTHQPNELAKKNPAGIDGATGYWFGKYVM
jgi:hypothetical protein